MDRIGSILFSPLTFSGTVAATRRVAAFAAHHDATVTLFDAVPAPSRLERLRHGEQFEAMIAEAESRTAERRLETLRVHLGERAAPTVVATGDPATAIIEQVTTGGHDLVVVTADDDPGARTTLKRLERSCPCPVWVVRPTRARTQRVLAAVDTDPSHSALNQSIVQMAADMVAFDGGELHLLHAWTLYGESALRSSGFARVPLAELDAMLDAEHAARAAALETLLRDAGVDRSPWQIQLVKGSAAAAVIDTVNRLRINMLGIGTAARSGLSGLVIGNTAETVLADVPCSVITVKSPVATSRR